MQSRFAVLLWLTCSVAQAQTPSIERPFDGTNLDDWKGAPGYWSVEDGVLVGESTPEHPCEQSTYLIWQGAPLADFDLSLEFRIPSGNSGVQFRSAVRPDGSILGYQADMEAGPNWTGCLYEQGGRGVLVRRGEELIVGASGEAQRTRFADDASMASLRKDAEWNRYRIRAVGAQVELFVNGTRTVKLVDEHPQAARARGALALQLHAGTPMRVEYRNFELIRLGEGAAPAAVEAPDEDQQPGPRWIWSAEHGLAGAHGSAQVWLRREFQLEQPASEVRLFGTCDNACEVFLDGERVAVGDDWARPFERDLKNIAAGRHVLSVHARNSGGPAAFLLKLSAGEDGERRTLLESDSNWSVSSEAPEGDWQEVGELGAGWLPATVVGSYGMAPWGEPSARSSGLAELALAGSELSLPPGFEGELLYSVPKQSQGSWVAMTFDGRGRLVVSDQRGSLWRVTLGELGTEPKVMRMDLPLGRAQGLLQAFGSLYVVVSEGEGTGLYRCRDTNGDDRYDQVELLMALGAGGEHGPHAVIVHPDGRSLVLIAGNHVPLPPEVLVSRATRAWAEDQLLERVLDPRGHANHVRAPGGWVCKLDPDGKNWELIAHGMRNGYDVAVGPGGELFTFDSDMEWDVGLPWYRPTRVLHLLSGADFGWRTGSGKFPDHWEDSVGSVVDMGLASPTGVAFGSAGGFPGRFGEAFYVADWAYGSLHAVHLTAEGASFSGTSEIFARGMPFQITDLVFGPDGHMYLTTGGRGTQSGLYRIRCTDPSAVQQGKEVEATAVASGDSPAVRLRKNFEALHGRPGRLAAADVSELIEGLAHADRYVRYAARTAMEQMRVSDWLDLALADPRPRVVAGAVLAAARVSEEGLRPRLLAALADSWHADAKSEAARLWVRALQLVFTRLGDPGAERHAAWERRILDTLEGAEDILLERDLFQLLVRLGSERAPALGLARMAAATDQEQLMFYAFHLRHHAPGWNLERRGTFLRILDDARAGFVGGASMLQYVDRIGDGLLEAAPEQQRGALRAAREARKQAPKVPRDMAPFVRAWTRAELESLLAQDLPAGDTPAARAAFEKGRCLECHRVAGQGGATGPDLSGAGARFSTPDLLTAIHEPSLTINDQYQEIEVWTEDQQVVVGRLVAEDEGFLTLQPAAEGAQPVRVALAEIVVRRPHPLSRMPSGLLEVLSAEEVRALFAYARGLASGK